MKWHEYPQKKPNKSGNYLIFSENFFAQVVHYSKKYDAWNFYDEDAYDPQSKWLIKGVTHFAYINHPCNCNKKE